MSAETEWVERKPKQIKTKAQTSQSLEQRKYKSNLIKLTKTTFFHMVIQGFMIYLAHNGKFACAGEAYRRVGRLTVHHKVQNNLYTLVQL